MSEENFKMYVISSRRHGNTATSLLDMARLGPSMAVRHGAMEMSSKYLSYEA